MSIYDAVKTSRHVRPVFDVVPDYHLIIHPYLRDTLADMDTSKLSLGHKKTIVKGLLLGLADLHSQNIIHTGEATAFIQ